ncbi:MAG: response regulator, partial [Cyanobacteria bacterium J06553_1]
MSNAFKFTQTGHIVLRVRGSDDDPTIATLGHATLDNTTLGSTTVNNTGQENGLNQHSPQALSPQAPNPQAPNITLVFEVEDSGPGIVASELSTLFEPFVQTQTGRSSLQGTGLGLAISRKFVQLMGGDITLSSPVFDGSGTLASFHIQAALTTDIAIAGLMSPGQSPQHRIIAGLAPGQPSYRLLIVDDQTTNRKLLVKLLGPLGFELREVPDGPAAIAQCQRWQPHLILMDMRMPVMNGTETIQRIRALTTLTAQPKIVALSASTLLKEQSAAREAGCNAFMSKPFQETTLLHCIAQQIGAHYCYRETRVSGVAAQPGGAQVHQRAAQSVTQQTTAQQTTQGQSPVSHDFPSQSPSLLP